MPSYVSTRMHPYASVCTHMLTSRICMHSNAPECLRYTSVWQYLKLVLKQILDMPKSYSRRNSNCVATDEFVGEEDGAFTARVWEGGRRRASERPQHKCLGWATPSAEWPGAACTVRASGVGCRQRGPARGVCVGA